MRATYANVAARLAVGILGVAVLVGVVVGMRGQLGDAMRVVGAHGRWGWILGAAALGAAAAGRGWSPARLLLLVPARWFVGVAAVAALVSGIWAHHAVAKGVPDIPDEFGYLHQARTFADGHLTAPSPPASEFHYVSWGVHDGGKWYAVFPPGYGALLAVGVVAGAPGLVNPVLGALLVLVLFALARRMAGGDGVAPRVAVLCYLASWFRLMHAASFMSHPTSALFAMLAAYGLWRGLFTRAGEPHPRRWGLVAGAALALLGATRQLDAVVMVIGLAPAVGYVLWRDRGVALRRLVWPIVAAAPLFAGQLAYNRELTGASLLPPSQRYMELKERRGDCFRLGFGPGVGECPITQGTYFGPGGFGPTDAIKNTQKRLHAWTRWSFGWVPLALLPALGLFGGVVLGGAAARRRALVGGVLVATVGLYGLFFYHGVTYGARFYYLAFPFAVILSGAAVADVGRLLGRLRGRAARFGAIGAGAIGAALLAVLLVGLVADRAPLQAYAGQRRLTQDGAQLRVLSVPAMHDALVFVDSMLIPAAMDLHPTEVGANHPLVVVDRGDLANAGFARIYPGRPTYRLVGTTIQPLTYPADAPMRHEAGAFYPLERSHGGFGDHVGADDAGKLALSAGDALRFSARAAPPGTAPGPASFAVPLWVLTDDAGDMDLELGLVMHPRGATFSARVDGQPVAVGTSTRAQGWSVEARQSAVTLPAGRHWLEVTMAPSAGSPDILLLDYVELRPAARPGAGGARSGPH